MALNFTKMNGAGNDFVVIDNRGSRFSGDEAPLFRALCDRRTGIGADGLILVEQDAEAPVIMRYFNADGLPAGMCGNGARCTAYYAWRNGWVGQHEFVLKSDQGLHDVVIKSEEVSLSMTRPHSMEFEPGLTVSYVEGGAINTGVPHYVLFAENLDQVDVANEAPQFRFHEHWGCAGVNVNFVQIVADGIAIRTYERGVEAETLACGTGCVAAALLASRRHHLKSPVTVHARGGTLSVTFDSGWQRVTLKGPAVIQFCGQVDDDWLKSVS